MQILWSKRCEARPLQNFLQAKSSFFRIAVAKITAAIERRRIRAALGKTG